MRTKKPGAVCQYRGVRNIMKEGRHRRYGKESMTMSETAKHGIDISRYQGKPDFGRLRDSVDFIIMQAGFGRYASQKDSEFERNYSECRKYDIPCGAYWFSYAATPDEARFEARACLDVLRGKKLEYPVYYDIEGSACSGDVSGKCTAFCEELENAGWFAGIYISRSPAQSYLNERCLKDYALWLAEYGSKLNWNGAVGMWQNSSTGRFPGISGDVDTDICYADYPSVIKSGGFNGWEKPTDTRPVLDKAGYKRGDKTLGVYALKQMLILAKKSGLVRQGVDDDRTFGEGTEKAVNSLLSAWGFSPNGTAGERFIQRLGRELSRTAGG